MNRPAGQSGVELDRLRELLLRPETDRLDAVEAKADRLDQRVGTPGGLEAATSEILVEAFRRAEIARHRELAGAVAPVVVAAIRNEIKNSKDMMVEALYPITGRLVTAAVANAFRDLVADLNERLDRTLSTQHWKLRFQSIVTGRPLSELALAQAQRPVLRRLLLLERGSGRLVASWNRDEEADSQSELVSGLIAAITEFASSVYGARSGELRTLDLGASRVFLRGAPVYLIAAECAGALRPEHEREIDDAFLSLVSRLDHAPDSAQPALEQMAETLFAQAAAKEKKSALPLILVLTAAACIAAWFASGPILRSMHERRIDAAFARALAAHPELAAYPLHVAVDHGARSVAIDGVAPSETAAKALSGELAPAAAPYSIVEHIAAFGTAAQTQELQRRAEELTAQVAALQAQLAAVEKANRAAIDQAFGQAVDKANEQTSAAARALQSQTAAASNQLGALIAAATPSTRDRVGAVLARTAIFFSKLATLADPERAGLRADEVAAAMKGNDLVVRVVGHADQTGSDRLNVQIAQQRAETVAAMLIARGLDPARVSVATRSSTLPLGAGSDLRDRRATFELAYEDEKRQ